MANALYPKGKEKILSAAINFPSDTIKAALVSSSYAYSAAHEFLTSLGTVIGTAQTLANKTITDGIFDADDVVFALLAAGSIGKGVVIYKDTGLAATSPLLAYFDAGAGLPFQTNGGDQVMRWSASSYKIFSL